VTRATGPALTPGDVASALRDGLYSPFGAEHRYGAAHGGAGHPEGVHEVFLAREDLAWGQFAGFDPRP